MCVVVWVACNTVWVSEEEGRGEEGERKLAGLREAAEKLCGKSFYPTRLSLIRDHAVLKFSTTLPIRRSPSLWDIFSLCNHRDNQRARCEIDGDNQKDGCRKLSLLPWRKLCYFESDFVFQTSSVLVRNHFAQQRRIGKFCLKILFPVKRYERIELIMYCIQKEGICL